MIYLNKDGISTKRISVYSKPLTEKPVSYTKNKFFSRPFRRAEERTAMNYCK